MMVLEERVRGLRISSGKYVINSKGIDAIAVGTFTKKRKKKNKMILIVAPVGEVRGTLETTDLFTKCFASPSRR